MLLTLTAARRDMHDAILMVAHERQDRLLGCLPKGGGERLVAYLDLLQAEADKMLAEHDALRGGDDKEP